MSTQRVLVAYGSKHGATAGIAEEIGRSLRDDGFEVVVAPAQDVDDVRDYDGVVLGGSLYAGRWNNRAERIRAWARRIGAELAATH